jgi:formyltetrahydrofolate hydrolase
MEKNHVVRIICPDQKGLIAAVAGVLYNNGINILAMKEFVESDTTTFFAPAAS